ncbi:MAG: hypothetical protein IK123_09515, partial [Lachnospiraceae bacterium]|nr:hypothetical protein [Lachnospiraceae bacterium]
KYRDNGYRVEDPNIRFAGRGQIVRDSSIAENVIDYLKAGEGIEKITDFDPEIKVSDINPIYPDTFREIAGICKDNGIRLIVVSAPLPVTEYYDSEYYLRHRILEQLTDEQGVEFYDLNMAKEDLYDPDPYGFYDNYHANDIGAKLYTEALADLLNRVDDIVSKGTIDSVKDESINSMFYTWEETCHRAETFLESIGLW